MRELKLGFDAKRLFCNKEGLGSYARTLLRDLQSAYPQHEYHLYTPRIDNSIDHSYFTESDRFIVHYNASASKFWRYSNISKDLKRDNIDVYIGLSNELPRGLSDNGVKSIVVIHDLLYKYYPSQFSLVDRLIIKHKLDHALSNADQVLAVSQHTKSDIARNYNISEEKIKVIYQAVNKLYRAETNTQEHGEYLLCVGSINERKNLKLLVDAYQHMDANDRVPVIIAGNGGRYKAELIEAIESYKLEHLFTFIGYVSDEKLIELYKKAIALVFPSRYEGFGIPVIESLSMNIPVIACNSSSIMEVVGQHGIVIDSYDSVVLSEAIIKIIDPNNRQTLLNGVEKHLTKFDPETICNAYLHSIKHTISS
jgi:glycosyltransferase involved in cell wall biosynthesis